MKIDDATVELGITVNPGQADVCVTKWDDDRPTSDFCRCFLDVQSGSDGIFPAGRESNPIYWLG